MKKTWAILLGALLCFTGAGALGAAEERFATLDDVKGTVEVRQPGADWTAATGGMVLHQMDEIRTGEKSSVKILLDHKGKTGTAKLRENSFLRLSTLQWGAKEEEKITYLDLALGRVLVQAGKLKGDSDFQVRTPTSTTGVRGTIFEVSVEGEE